MSNPEEEHENVEELEEDEMFARRERDAENERRDRLGVGNLFRRAIENTVGQVQNTSSVPKEALQYVLQQGDRGKREVVRLVANEVGDFLRHVDISSEIIKVLTSVEMDFSASIKFRHTGDGLSPEFSKQSGMSVSTDSPEASEDMSKEEPKPVPKTKAEPKSE